MKCAAPIMVSLLLASAAIAQEGVGPHFRFGFNGDLALPSYPDGTDNENPGTGGDGDGEENPSVTFTYPTGSTVAVGDPIHAPATITGGTPQSFAVYNGYPLLMQGIGVNSDGDIDFTPQRAGPYEITVIAYSDPDATFELARATYRFNATSNAADGFSISTTPPSVTVKSGTENFNQAFGATAVPAQSGGSWSVETSLPGNAVSSTGASAVFDMNTLLNDAPWAEGEHYVQFLYTGAEGSITQSDQAKINILPGPNVSYGNVITESYRVDQNSILQVKPGASFSVPATFINGGTTVLSEPRAWMQPESEKPDWFNIAPNGTLSGTAPLTDGAIWSLLIPVSDGQGAYGSGWLSLAVMANFVDPNNPPTEEPEEPGEPVDTGEVGGAIYYANQCSIMSPGPNRSTTSAIFWANTDYFSDLNTDCGCVDFTENDYGGQDEIIRWIQFTPSQYHAYHSRTWDDYQEVCRPPLPR